MAAMAAMVLGVQAKNKPASLTFDANGGTAETLTMPDGKITRYKTYTHRHQFGNEIREQWQGCQLQTSLEPSA